MYTSRVIRNTLSYCFPVENDASEFVSFMEDATKIGRLDHFVAMKSHVSNSLSFACWIGKDRAELLRQVGVVVFVKASEKVMRYCLTLAHLVAISPEYKSIVIARALLPSGRKSWLCHFLLTVLDHANTNLNLCMTDGGTAVRSAVMSVARIKHHATCIFHLARESSVRIRERLPVGSTITTDLIRSDLYFVASSGGSSIFDRLFQFENDRQTQALKLSAFQFEFLFKTGL